MSVHTSTGGGVPGPGPGGGGVPDPAIDWRGVPGLRFSGGGPHVSDFLGGGIPGLRFSRGGGPRSQIFQGGGSPVSIKGKIFDTRFGLIHVQTGKKNFCRGTPLPRIAKNCYGYAAGGMPLAFTQEDFLVTTFFGNCDQLDLS